MKPFPQSYFTGGLLSSSCCFLMMIGDFMVISVVRCYTRCQKIRICISIWYCASEFGIVSECASEFGIVSGLCHICISKCEILKGTDNNKCVYLNLLCVSRGAVGNGLYYRPPGWWLESVLLQLMGCFIKETHSAACSGFDQDQH